CPPPSTSRPPAVSIFTTDGATAFAASFIAFSYASFTSWPAAGPRMSGRTNAASGQRVTIMVRVLSRLGRGRRGGALREVFELQFDRVEGVAAADFEPDGRAGAGPLHVLLKC